MILQFDLTLVWSIRPIRYSAISSVSTFGTAYLLSEKRDFGSQAVDHRLLVAVIRDLLDLRLALNGTGALRILHSIQRLAQMKLGRSDTSNHVRDCIATQRVLQQAGQLRISV